MTKRDFLLVGMLLGSGAALPAGYTLANGEQAVEATLEAWTMPSLAAAEIGAAFDASFPGFSPKSFVCFHELGSVDGVHSVLAVCRAQNKEVWLGERVATMISPGLDWNRVSCSSAQGAMDGKSALVTQCKVDGYRLKTLDALKPGDKIVLTPTAQAAALAPEPVAEEVIP